MALAAELAGGRGWRPEAELLTGRAVDLARKRAVDLRAAAVAAANGDEPAHALALLREAVGLAPADGASLEALLEVATRSGDESALADARRLYLTLGWSTEYVDALASRARSSGLGHLEATDSVSVSPQKAGE